MRNFSGIFKVLKSPQNEIIFKNKVQNEVLTIFQKIRDHRTADEKQRRL